MPSTDEPAVPTDQSAAFGRLAQGPDEEVPLDRCAIEVGRIVDPDLDAEQAVARLDGLALTARSRLRGDPREADVVDAVRAVLFEDDGFSGEGDDYYAPRNSCLHAVLEARCGLPITLSVLFIEVARRMGVRVDGVGMPGHFLVKFRDEAGEHFLDPFRSGKSIPRDDLRRRMRGTRGGGADADSYLAAVTKRQILQRILNNLKGAFVRQRDFNGALATTNYLLALTPWALDEVRDRGFLHYELGSYPESIENLRTYHEHVSDAPDSPRVAAMIQRVQSRIDDA